MLNFYKTFQAHLFSRVSWPTLVRDLLRLAFRQFGYFFFRRFFFAYFVFLSASFFTVFNLINSKFILNFSECNLFFSTSFASKPYFSDFVLFKLVVASLCISQGFIFFLVCIFSILQQKLSCL